MKIDTHDLTELRQICRQLAEREFSDLELHEIAERIVRFLLNSDGCRTEFDRQ